MANAIAAKRASMLQTLANAERFASALDVLSQHLRRVETAGQKHADVTQPLIERYGDEAAAQRPIEFRLAEADVQQHLPRVGESSARIEKHAAAADKFIAQASGDLDATNADEARARIAAVRTRADTATTSVRAFESRLLDEVAARTTLIDRHNSIVCDVSALNDRVKRAVETTAGDDAARAMALTSLVDEARAAHDACQRLHDDAQLREGALVANAETLNAAELCARVAAFVANIESALDEARRRTRSLKVRADIDRAIEECQTAINGEQPAKL